MNAEGKDLQAVGEPQAEGPKGPKEAILKATEEGCPDWIAAAAGDMTRLELRRLLEEEDFARRLEIARGKAGVTAIGKLWKAEAKEVRVWMWILENLVLGQRMAADAKGEGRRGKRDEEGEGEDRVSPSLRKLLDALARLGEDPCPPLENPADGRGGTAG